MPSITPPLDTGVPQLLVDHTSGTGEGPLWHEEGRYLTWIDIPAGQLFRYTPDAGTHELIYQHTGQIGGYTIQRDGALIVFADNGAIFRLIGDMPDPIFPEIEELRGTRFNDVIADPEGRIFAGTMPLGDGSARLYRLDPNGELTLLYDDLTLSNGMGFSPDLATFYLTDSNSHRIYAIEYDRATGNLGKRTTLITTAENEIVPDGMAVDRDGAIWSAQYGGGGILKYTPEGKMIGKVELPVRNVTSITFGGPHFATAFVTSAGGAQRGEQNGFLAGSLFRLNPKTHGTAPFRSRIGMT
ncbi:MAG TPA: SMP-30/gluconolactonase/LRE family protein [Thermomicrobiales bacterium]|nr:SMP-30/gluconolactonase/LRE family protein [Thermomicrobiales bacterium]